MCLKCEEFFVRSLYFTQTYLGLNPRNREIHRHIEEAGCILNRGKHLAERESKLGNEEVFVEIVPGQGRRENESRVVGYLFSDLMVRELFEILAKSQVENTCDDCPHTVLKRVDVHLNGIHYLHELSKHLITL